MLFNVQSSLSWEHFSCYVIPWTESEVIQVAMTLIFYKGKPKLSYKVSYNEVDLKKRLKGESVTMITAAK